MHASKKIFGKCQLNQIEFYILYSCHDENVGKCRVFVAMKKSHFGARNFSCEKIFVAIKNPLFRRDFFIAIVFFDKSVLIPYPTVLKMENKLNYAAQFIPN